MENPIQTVLAAEQTARQQIENARNAADETLKDARRRARSIVQRSEERTQRAIVNFEQRQAKATSDEIRRLRKQHRRTLQKKVTRLENKLDAIADDVTTQFWPHACADDSSRDRAGDKTAGDLVTKPRGP